MRYLRWWGLGLLLMATVPLLAQNGWNNDAEQCAREDVTGDTAIMYCTRAIQSGQLSDVNLAVTLYNRGNTYMDMDQYQKAADDFTAAMRFKQDASYYNNRGMCYRELKDFDRALADYNEALRIDPQHASTFNNRGNLWRDRGQTDKAIADYTEAIRLKPDYAKAYQNRCRSYRDKGWTDRADADCAKADQLSSQSH